MTQARLYVALASMLTGSFVAGCSPSEPAAENVSWSIQRTPDKKAYQVTATADVIKGFGGFYFPTVTLTDDRGCHTELALNTLQDAIVGDKKKVRADFSETVALKRPVATAILSIRYNQLPEGSYDPADVIRTGLFSEEQVVDPNVKVSEYVSNPCGKTDKQVADERRARLRERAKTDPDGADAAAIGGMSRNETVATAINTAGFLCARVTDLYPSGGGIIASCVEYRNGQGKAKYRIDTGTMSVERIE